MTAAPNLSRRSWNASLEGGIGLPKGGRAIWTPRKEQGGGWAMNVPGRVSRGKKKSSDKKNSDHIGSVGETHVLKTYSNSLITYHSLWLRLEVL